MILRRLLLRNFRNYQSQEFTFNHRINVFCGGNAQGKTNLLEAIYFISTGKSFRTAKLQELIKENTPYFYIEAEIIKDDCSEIVKIYYNGKEKKNNS